MPCVCFQIFGRSDQILCEDNSVINCECSGG